MKSKSKATAQDSQFDVVEYSAPVVQNDQSALVAELMAKLAETEAALHAAKNKPVRVKGFTEADTMALIEAGVTETQLYEAILGAASVNEARWISARNRTRVVINSVYAKLGSPIAEEPASKELKASVAALVPAAKPKA